MNKKLIGGLLIIVTLATAALLWNSLKTQPSPAANKQTEANPSKITLTYSYAKANQLPVIVASEKGLFKKYNLQVDIKQVNKNVTSVVTSGNADVMLGTPNIPLTAAVQGAGLSWIGSVNNDQALVVVSIKDIKNIKSAGVITGPGRVQTIGLLKFLGVDTKNIVYQELAGNTERLLAIQQKQVDVINVPKPDWFNFKRKANLPDDEYKILLDSTSEKQSQLPIGIVVRNEFLQNNKSTVEKFVKALLEADFWISNKDNKEEFINILERHYSDNSRDDVTVEVESYLSTLDGLEFTPNLEKGVELLKLIAVSIPEAKDYNLNNFINTEISQSLKNSGFLATLGFN